ncbi:hypothetical protein [Mixta intestinalis]|uniref:hypothetical protein n=1 Tax=Mixta intestinalis TaxID=1615494 RepID=UPI00136DE0D5|nr:hypothetical protein [Mixta intestinalis]
MKGAAPVASSFLRRGRFTASAPYSLLPDHPQTLYLCSSVYSGLPSFIQDGLTLIISARRDAERISSKAECYLIERWVKLVIHLPHFLPKQQSYERI